MRRVVSSATELVAATRLSRRHRGYQRDPRLRAGRWLRPALLAGLVPALLAIAALFPSAASAYTRGFHVYDFSSYPLMLNGIVNGAFDSAPAAGSILQPGVGYHDFEETYYFLADTQGEVSYSVRNSGVGIGTFSGTMYIESNGLTDVSCMVDLGACTPRDVTRGDTLTYLDPPGTVHDIPAGQGQAQAATLKQLCADDNSASCVFTATSEQQVDSPTHELGNALINNTDVEQDTSITVTDTVGQSDSVGVAVKVGGKIAKIVDVSITATYSHEWTTSHTFSQTVLVHCPAHTKCFIKATQPMLRDTGDFTLKLGNTTWNLPGVYFDSPNPNGSGAYEVDTQPLTASQRATLPPGVTKQTLLRGIYTLPEQARAGRIARPKLLLSIAGPGTVTAGQIANYRITLRRGQPSDRLVYSLKDVRVVGEHAGHRVGHWRLHVLPPGRERTLDLQVAAPRGHERFCVTVSAYTRHAVGDTARYCAAVAGQSVGGLG